MPTVESLVPLMEPLRVTIYFVAIYFRGSLLTLSKPKLEALGGLGKIKKNYLRNLGMLHLLTLSKPKLEALGGLGTMEKSRVTH